MDVNELAAHIDQTILRPEATIEEVRAVCREAAGSGFATVFTHPAFTSMVVSELKGSGVRAGTTCGFPFGQNLTAAKVFEAQEAVRQGADEIDMVHNISWLKSGMALEVEQDIAAVVAAAKEAGRRRDGAAITVKVIIEAGLLTDEEKVASCDIAVRAGVDFVKTSTSFLAGGATVADVALLRRSLPDSVGVKASGGIRDLGQAMAFLDAGASRLGTSAGAEIIEQFRDR